MKINLALATLIAFSFPSALTAFESENLTARCSFSNSLAAFKKNENARVAFMGGSITEMNGYRPMVAKWLEERFPKTKFDFINAGISSTCSTTGAFRLQRDVLSHGPVDLFFIEFAVNDDQDAGHPKEACIRGMEGIIRKMRLQSPKTDLVVTYFVNPGMLEKLKKGKTPVPMAAHERVLQKYGVSRVHLARELAWQIKQGTFSWEKFGGTHPKEPGNRLCADMHIEMLSNAWSVKDGEAHNKKTFPSEPIDPNSYFNGRFFLRQSLPNRRMEIFRTRMERPSGRKTDKIPGRPLLQAKPRASPSVLRSKAKPSEPSSAPVRTQEPWNSQSTANEREASIFTTVTARGSIIPGP